MFEWFKDTPQLLQGSLLTLLGFLFAIAWDINKSNREKSEKEKTIISALINCLDENINRIEKNRRILWHENDLNQKNKEHYNNTPFVLLDTTQIWSFFTLHIPDKLISDPEIIGLLRNLAVEADFVNNTIKERDLFKTTQKNIRPFISTILEYGKRIEEQLNTVEILVKNSLIKLK